MKRLALERAPEVTIENIKSKAFNFTRTGIFVLCLLCMSGCERAVRKTLCNILGSLVGTCVSIVWPPHEALDRILHLLGAGGAGYGTYLICDGLLEAIYDEDGQTIQPTGLRISTHCDESGAGCQVVSLEYSFAEDPHTQHGRDAIPPREFEEPYNQNSITASDFLAVSPPQVPPTTSCASINRNTSGSTSEGTPDVGDLIPVYPACEQLGTCNSEQCCQTYYEACNSPDSKKFQDKEPAVYKYLCELAMPLECER